MSRGIYSVIFVLNIMLLTGCTGTTHDEVSETQHHQDSNGSPPSDTFKNHYADAGKFLDRIHQADEFLSLGKYSDAIKSYNLGLELNAYSRPEQTRALEGIAKSYEGMGNFKNASKYYELASEVTMNEDRRVSLSQKAKELNKP